MYKYLLVLFLCLSATTLQATETVVLLHGLARTPESMRAMEKALTEAGYDVHNFGYESRKHTIEKLAQDLKTRIEESTGDRDQVHFVTHSMGGILLRYIQSTDPIKNIGRAVLLSPPNQGSEIVDNLGENWAFKKINGPAGQQLGTDQDGFTKGLGPVNFECGVITGDHSINWINSAMIPGDDDGKVSVESAKVDGMADFKVVSATHPMIMMRKSVIEETIHFLAHGEFKGK